MTTAHRTHDPPPPSAELAATLAREVYGVPAEALHLAGERDCNFLVEAASGERFVLKIAEPGEAREALVAQNRAMERVSQRDPSLRCPRVVATLKGEQVAELRLDQEAGSERLVRMLTYVPGTPLARAQPHTAELLRSLGGFLGRLDAALDGFTDAGARRTLKWDLTHAAVTVRGLLDRIADRDGRALLERFLLQFDAEVASGMRELRTSVIHNDANDHNVLVGTESGGESEVVGIIDFGDMVEACTVFELAVGAAYACLGKDDPVAATAHVVEGYNQIVPLTELEVDLLFGLIVMRLCMSVSISADQQKRDPGNEYLTISEKPAWAALRQLAKVGPAMARKRYRGGCNMSVKRAAGLSRMSRDEVLGARQLHTSRALSTSYEEPLYIVRGSRQYLYDEQGRAYLDAVNNVCHVGHCHPHVVRAAQEQLAKLNTNTRYLHDNLVRYTARLCSTFPEPLSVCFLVCSGSEANELALRLARAHTGRLDVVVVDGAYHGNTSALIDISPYKHGGSGGSGAPPHVHSVSTPDVYRGPHRGAEAGDAYAADVERAIAAARDAGRQVGAFIVEPLLGCAGQIEPPPGYLEGAFENARAAGAVCIADEVQVGFGRVGTHFWGFETQGVVPDIVTLGKPIGNGHPMGAVITKPEIARSFENGMEYFNTFGGNPVSCAVGLAVLDVIEQQELQKNALEVGEYLKAALSSLMETHRVIGDVRGRGLFLGVELVSDRSTREPAGDLAADVVERMKKTGVLTSRDGPFRNVLKIKPPLVFSRADADYFVSSLDRVLASTGSATAGADANQPEGLPD